MPDTDEREFEISFNEMLGDIQEDIERKERDFRRVLGIGYIIDLVGEDYGMLKKLSIIARAKGGYEMVTEIAKKYVGQKEILKIFRILEEERWLK